MREYEARIAVPEILNDSDWPEELIKRVLEDVGIELVEIQELT